MRSRSSGARPRIRAALGRAPGLGRWGRLVGLEVLVVGLPAVFVLLAGPGPYSWSVVAGLAACALLPLRHVWPPLAVLGTLPAIVGGLGWPPEIVALFALGRRWGRFGATVPWLVLTVLATVVPVVLRETMSWRALTLSMVFALLSAGSPLGFGLLTATRERLTASLRELRDAREAALAARESAARAEERARIGREVHDAVGHHATLIAVTAAALASSTREPATREAAERLRQQAKAALAEMRSTLVGAAGPHPGAAEVAELVEQARQNGLDVALVAHGADRPLAAAPDQTVYRVVQEALTNAARHAPGSSVTVELDWRRSDEIAVAVRNGLSSRPTAFPGGGAGLVGLDARVRSIGGTLAHGPSDTGFAVRAVLPLAPATPARGVPAPPLPAS